MEHFERFVNLLKSVSEENEIEEYHISDELATTRLLSNDNLQLLKTHKANCKKCLFLVIGSRAFVEKVILSSKDLSLINMLNKWVFILTEPAPIGLLSDHVKDIVSESDILLTQSVRNHNCIAFQVECLVDIVADVLQKSFYQVIVSSNLTTITRRQVKNRILSQSKVSVIQ